MIPRTWLCFSIHIAIMLGENHRPVCPQMFTPCPLPVGLLYPWYVSFTLDSNKKRFVIAIILNKEHSFIMRYTFSLYILVT